MIRYVESHDKMPWYTLDGHLPEAGFEEKVRNRQGYICMEDGKIIGILRYNLFWDSIPFCTLLYKDSGGFVVDIPGYEQPMEMIMVKSL